ncbi:helix-turn-helix domain-containing protein [Streptomyces sp. NPDC000229]|uniref:helix-turn-helix domain-containing protein n=1 Tax=Streptomyces sp. NPDC000229 TaxID=3154247 RepID=UPI00332BB9C9
MDTKHFSAPTRRQRGNVRTRTHTAGGVIHDNARHHTQFTVIGNHLAQHAELSLTAIGLSVHIQSLPTGALVDIKTLAHRFPEGADRIAGALRELEAHGYLRRVRERVSNGRLITRTISCNQPGARRTDDDPSAPAPDAPERPARREPAPLAVPQPAYPAPSLLRTALDVLAGLHRQDPRLLLSARDAERLAPGVAAWLERDVSADSVRDALTTNLPPDRLHRPAALLAHRLTAQLPPPPPFRAPSQRLPLQNCDRCDRAFRAAEPGECGECQLRASS